MSIVAHRLKLAQIAKGWPNSAAAEKLEVTVGTYRKYVNGTSSPRASFLVKASEVYDKKVGWFYGE